MSVPLQTNNKYFLCPCKETNLINEISKLPAISDDELSQVLSPYSMCSISIINHSTPFKAVSDLLARKTIQTFYIQDSAVKGFSIDGQFTSIIVNHAKQLKQYTVFEETPYMF